MHNYKTEYIYRNAQIEVAALEAGGMVGEMSLLTGKHS
jgi:hypothetical protein